MELDKSSIFLRWEEELRIKLSLIIIFFFFCIWQTPFVAKGFENRIMYLFIFHKT